MFVVAFLFISNFSIALRTQCYQLNTGQSKLEFLIQSLDLPPNVHDFTLIQFWHKNI